MYTFEQLEKANRVIRTTNIKGKEYAEVNQRIKAFRMVCPNGTINTEMISNDGGICVFRAFILDEDGKLLGTGTAYEDEKSSRINNTSYIENCETSAVGRALGMCGFGIDTSVASAEEVGNAIENQNKTANKPQAETPKEAPVDYRQKLIALLEEHNVDMTAYAQEKKINTKTSQSVFKKLCEEFERK